MACTVSSKTAVVSDAKAAAPVSISSPEPKPGNGALNALVAPTLAATLVSNVQKTTVLAMDTKSVEKTEVSKESKKKRDSLLKFASGFLRRGSPDKASPLDPIEALTAAISQLAVHADCGEMSKHHQRQLSPLSTKSVELTESGTSEDDGDVERPSSASEHEVIHLLGAPRGGGGVQRKTSARKIRSPPGSPTHGGAKGGQGRGSRTDRIAAHHFSDSRPDEDDMASFQRRLDKLSKLFQTFILSYGGNTHRDMLQVMSCIELQHSEASPLLRVVYKGENDYKPRPDGKPPAPRQNCGIKSVICTSCDRDYKTIGHAAAHLTETHWGLKPWRCMTCYERFSHPDVRMTKHTDSCPFASSATQGAGPSSGATSDVRWGPVSNGTYMLDAITNGYGGGGVYYVPNNPVPSTHPPAVYPNYTGNASFNGQLFP